MLYELTFIVKYVYYYNLSSEYNIQYKGFKNRLKHFADIARELYNIYLIDFISILEVFDDLKTKRVTL